MGKSGLQGRWSSVWPLLGLCPLAGSRWLLESAHPEAQDTALTHAAGCWMAAGFALLMTLALRRRREVRGPKSGDAIARFELSYFGGGTAALAGAALAAAISSRFVNANNATLALALVPCVTAVAMSASGYGGGADLPARLWPGLAGVAGLLLLLPQPVFTDWRYGLAFAAMPLLVGVGSSAFSTSCAPEVIRGPQRGSPACTVLLLAGFAFGLLSLRSFRGSVASFSWGIAALDGLLALLSLLALQRLGATRWAAQFLLTPLITLLEGAVLLRPVLDLRSWLAFALLAVSGGYLLLIGRGKTETTVSISSPGRA